MGRAGDGEVRDITRATVPQVTDQRAQGNARVDGLAFVSAGGQPRLDFPHAQLDDLRGEAGGLHYGATDVTLERLTGRLRGVDWSMQSASAGGFWLRDRAGRFEMTIDRVELPHGLRITRAAAGGIELVAPHASFADVKLSIPDLAALRRAPAEPAEAPAEPSAPPAPAEPPHLRQEQLRFLDAVSGMLAFRLAVALDLPVIGKRTLDQSIKVAIENGTFDYKQLEAGLNWLEGAFLDVGVERNRFQVGWRVPIFGQTTEIISWALDSDATAHAAFGRVPLRALADFRIPSMRSGGGKAPAKDGDKSRLRSLTLGDLELQLHMVAPRNLDVGGGTIRFGGDAEPGIVDLRVSGALVHPPAPGAIKAVAGALDMTLKDIRLGGLQLTADRMTVGPIDMLAIAFDGFRPKSLAAVVHRVTATNLSLTVGGSPAA